MSRISAMTVGLVLVFIGVQLYLVKSYLLTPSATRFLRDNFHNSNNGSMFAPAEGNSGASNQNSWTNWNPFGGQSSSRAGQSWPFYATGSGQSSQQGIFQNGSWQTPSNPSQLTNAASVAMGGGHRLVPPGWLMWPFLFLGIVLFLHGAALRG